MHTFFINTSKRKFEEYNVLWDIQHENKKMISLDCPFSKWFDEENGYKNCVKQISNVIDAYAEVDNGFNVIIYVDLTSNPIYAAIDDDVLNNRERKACLAALQKLYTRTVSKSILTEFTDVLREPENVLIMFGEHTIRELEYVESKDPEENEITEKIAAFLGMPNEEEIIDSAKLIKQGQDADKVLAFKEQIMKVWKEGLFPDIISLYKDEMALWCDYIVNTEDIASANAVFFGKILKTDTLEIIKPYTTSCPCDRIIGSNTGAEALNQLNIMMHVLNCVETGSVVENKANFKVAKQFHVYSAKEIAKLLKRKEQIFSKKIKEIESFSELYASENLAPQLDKFDHEKFCLDEFGDRATDLVIVEESAEKKDKEENNTGTYEDLNELDRIEIAQIELESLFSESDYPLFEYDDESGNEKPTIKTKPDEYVEYGKRVKRMHMNFIKRFKIHTSERLSDYAGRSKENKPALLKIGEYRYAKKEDTERRALETVEQISDNAYNTVLKRYMEFCAGRSVSVTDISKQCDIFVTRIRQIAESLSKKRFVALAALLALIGFYLPLVLISRKFMVHNSLTALCFVAAGIVPVLVGVFAYIKAHIEQKRKYIDEHEALTRESERIMAGNKSVAKKYDQLLSSVIPALRWVYEYKLDVEHYAQCCRIAELKLAHHRVKLTERVKAIRNILSDIECNISFSEDLVESVGAIDYGVPFCFGDRNMHFYTIADGEYFANNKSEEVDDE